MPTFYPVSKLIGKKINYYRKINELTLIQLGKIVGSVNNNQDMKMELTEQILFS